MIHASRRRIAVICVALVALGLTGCGLASSINVADVKPGTYTIALSNAFLGNTWRQTMVKVFEHTARQAQQQGLIKGYKTENTTDNTATEQIAQLKSLILQRVNAILIDAAAPAALNPTIKQACDVGITVIVFDSLATAPCAYKLEDSLADYGYKEGQFVASAMGGKGNLLMVRGVVGSAPEQTIHSNQLKAISKYPQVKVVGNLIGQASNAVTQQVVAGALPSLPTIGGAVSGGSSLGAAQAFQSAGKPIPAVAFDNSGEGLRFWSGQLAKNSQYAAASVRTEPGQAAAAFWIALDLLQGHKVKNQIYTFPNILITRRTLPDWLKVTPNGNVATWLWTRAETRRVVQANLRGNTTNLPQPPIPTTAP
ncbi:MAG: substrate-binding domain-containing protein [Solirubrobacterales bacterium]|nr:substrate-binding domain-containing protein [Solirubrobacterales bacterium]